jgi:hypothetical protein
VKHSSWNEEFHAAAVTIGGERSCMMTFIGPPHLGSDKDRSGPWRRRRELPTPLMRGAPPSRSRRLSSVEQTLEYRTESQDREVTERHHCDQTGGEQNAEQQGMRRKGAGRGRGVSLASK